MSDHNQISKPVINFTIEHLFNHFQQGKLFLRPVLKNNKRSFQRLPWWKRNKKIYLIHSIFEGTTLPPIFMYQDKNLNIHIVDGQQRLSAIFEYLQDEYKTTQKGMLEKDHPSENLSKKLEGNKFSKLDEDSKDRILDYNLRIEEIQGSKQRSNVFGQKIQDLFHRLNVTSDNMTAMEIWNNTYSGDLIDLLFDIQSTLGFTGPDEADTQVNLKDALLNYSLASMRVVSRSDILRMQDIDLILQLAMAIDKKGPQHKEEGIKQFCADNATMTLNHKNRIKKAFMENILIIEQMNSGDFDFAKSEFKKKHDFYSLFCAVDEMRRKGEISAKTVKSELIRKGKRLAKLGVAIRSCMERDADISTVTSWDKINISYKKKLPTYVESKRSNWSFQKSRKLRADLIRAFLVRKAKA